jgi:gluconate 5-dehydrogenase
MTRQLGAEWAMKGVTVNTVCPGWFLSEVTASTAANEEFLEKVVKAWCPMQRWAEPKELDPAIIFMASAENSYMTGVTFAVDGGYSAV